jgi:hypothetical protein
MGLTSELVFISYCHKDKRWLDRLLVHLKPLEQAGKIIPWADERIQTGEDWKTEIENSLAEAKVAVLLVSADFLASDFIASNELPVILAAAKERGLVVLPIILSPCRYRETSTLSSLQSLNPPEKSLLSMGKAKREQYLVELSIQIEGVLPRTAAEPVAKDTKESLHSIQSVEPMPAESGGYTRSSSRLAEVVSSPVGEDVSIFAEQGNQWALIIGTQPKHLTRAGEIDIEVIDAIDVLDWFWSPDVYGLIPYERTFCYLGEMATTENISWAFQEIEKNIQDGDSLLFYYSGHATKLSDPKVPDPGELILYDAFKGGKWGTVTKKTRGILPTVSLIEWCNKLCAAKVVCIMDSGGSPCYEAAALLKEGRYLISSLNSRVSGRNGWLTWHVRRTLQKFGRRATVAQLYDILKQADSLSKEPMHVYLRGCDIK